DEGGSGNTPRIPTQRSEQAWEWAEGQRGLVIIEQLSMAWGYHRTAPWADLGTHVWADLALTPDQAPRRPRPYVFADCTTSAPGPTLTAVTPGAATHTRARPPSERFSPRRRAHASALNSAGPAHHRKRGAAAGTSPPWPRTWSPPSEGKPSGM